MTRLHRSFMELEDESVHKSTEVPNIADRSIAGRFLADRFLAGRFLADRSLAGRFLATIYS